MSPEQAQINELKAELATLRQVVNDMQRPNLITPEFKQVLDRSVVSTSGKGATDENRTVNETGSAPPYSVLGPPDGFSVIGGKHYAYWDN